MYLECNNFTKSRGNVIKNTEKTRSGKRSWSNIRWFRHLHGHFDLRRSFRDWRNVAFLLLFPSDSRSIHVVRDSKDRCFVGGVPIGRKRMSWSEGLWLSSKRILSNCLPFKIEFIMKNIFSKKDTTNYARIIFEP